VWDRDTLALARVSVSSSGVQANGESNSPAISSDGRYVAFDSDASNLVSGDTNGRRDVFVHDRQTGQTTRVSISSGGVQGNAVSVAPTISADGHYVAFNSVSSTLVSGDTNNESDVFVHDRQTGQTTRVSVSSSGAQGNFGSGSQAISADGRYVAFLSSATNLVSGDNNGNADVFVHDRQTAITTRVSISSGGAEANGSSYEPVISADGRYVAFHSYATNLVSGDTNGERDVFVHDRQTGQTTRVSVSSGGVQASGASVEAAISGDGRYVAFDSWVSNLVSGDTNNTGDVFVRQCPGALRYLYPGH
jgi:Tol biopolymer transport system component